jgi:thioredoxin
MLKLIDIWAPWCLPCKKISPILDKLSEEFGDSVELIKINADLPENEELLREHDVKSIPTLLILSDDKVVGKSIGAKTEIQLRTWIETHLEKAAAFNV